MQSLCAGVAAAHGAQAELRILPGYPPTMGAEDFAYTLLARPGAYGWIGNGPGTGVCLLHNPRYDFNDALLAIGASYRATLVERELAP